MLVTLSNVVHKNSSVTHKLPECNEFDELIR